jgi:hypothetical protein
MKAPVGPHGPHERLQQPPPQGRPPSGTPVMGAQSMPSVMLQLADVVGGEPQVPSV